MLATTPRFRIQEVWLFVVAYWGTLGRGNILTTPKCHVDFTFLRYFSLVAELVLS